MAVDESSEHVMSVWDWQKTDRGQRITEVKVSVLAATAAALLVVLILILIIISIIIIIITFHVRAAATGNTRSPTVDSRVGGTSNVEVEDDHRCCRPGILATG